MILRFFAQFDICLNKEKASLQAALVFYYSEAIIIKRLARDGLYIL